MVRQAISGLCATVLAFAPIASNAACFTDTEWQAAHVRVLQTELQVAALECANVAGHNYNEQYSNFISRFQDRLKANATALKAHFDRLFGRDSGRQLDIFVTKVANDASGRSMQDMRFCADSSALFDSALTIEKKDFESAAVGHATADAQLGERCTTPTQSARKPVAVAAARSAG